MPDEEDEANVEKLKKKYPDAMPYFFSQDPDYITVKERVAWPAWGEMQSWPRGWRELSRRWRP